MRLPDEARERENTIQRVLGECLVSIGDRRTRYESLRKWFLYGSSGDVAARFNKIYPTIDQLTAFTFSQESTRFAIEVDEDEETAAEQVGQDINEQGDLLAAAIRDTWHDGHGDSQFTLAVVWAFVYGCTFLKPVWQGGVLNYYMVEPGAVGVLREDSPFMDDQEAFVHCYTIGRDQLKRILSASGKSEDDIKKFMARVPVMGGDKTTPQEENFVGRLVISQSQPTMVGNIADLQNWSSSISPQVKEDLVEMNELWVWDDGIDEYRIITLASQQFVLLDRPASSVFVKGEGALIKVCASEVYDYFWGKSEVEALIPLQQWREERMRQIDGLWQRQLNPPTVMSGFMGMTEEKAAALFRPRGQISDQNPAAKVDRLTPSMPPDVFAEIREIDAMFEYTVGLPPITQGRGEPGVRSGDQATEMSRMPGARMRKRSLQIEAALEKVGDLTFKMLRRESRRVYTTQDGTKFTAGQFPARFAVKVAAHTSSPMFSEDLRSDAQLMFKEGVIDGHTLLELMDPPMVQTLISRYRKRQKAQDDEAKQEKDMLVQALQHLAPPEKADIITRLLTKVGIKKS